MYAAESPMCDPIPSEKPVDPRAALLNIIEEAERDIAYARKEHAAYSEKVRDIAEYLEQREKALRSAAHELIGRLGEVTGDTCEGQPAPDAAFAAAAEKALSDRLLGGRHL